MVAFFFFWHHFRMNGKAWWPQKGRFFLLPWTLTTILPPYPQRLSCFSKWMSDEGAIVARMGASQVALYQVVKNLPANAGDVRDSGLIPELGRSPGGGNGNPLHYSCLENPMERGAWWATVSIVHRVAKSWTRLKWVNMHMSRMKLSQNISFSIIHLTSQEKEPKVCKLFRCLNLYLNFYQCEAFILK